MRTVSNKSPRGRGLLPVIAILLGVGLAPASAFADAKAAQDREEAKRAYTEARKLAKENKPLEALAMFRRAHELAPTPVTRVDLARALVGQGKLIEAHALAATTGDMPVTATETQKSKVARKEATELAAALSPRIPKITLVIINPSGETEVAIDGLPVSKELLTAEIALDPGDHVLVARGADRSVEVPITLQEGDRRPITVEVPQPPPVAPPVEPPPAPKVAPKPPPRRAAPPAEDDGVHPIVPVLLTVGGVSLLAGAVTGAIALSQVSDFDRCADSGACPGDLRDELSTHHALTTTSTVTFIVGGVATAAGVTGWIIDAASGPSTSPQVQARFTGTGIALEGTW